MTKPTTLLMPFLEVHRQKHQQVQTDTCWHTDWHMLVHTLIHYSTYTTMAHSLTYTYAHTQIYAHDRQCRKFLLLTDHHHCWKCISKEWVRCWCTSLSGDKEVHPPHGKEDTAKLHPFYFQKSSITCPGKMVFVPTDMIINIAVHLDASFLTNHKDLPVTSNTSHAD